MNKGARMMAPGSVKWFDRKCGSGFIELNGEDTDAFRSHYLGQACRPADPERWPTSYFNLAPLDDGRRFADRPL